MDQERRVCQLIFAFVEVFDGFVRPVDRCRIVLSVAWDQLDER